MSKAALAQKAGLHQTYIGMLENGDRSPSVDTAKAIADALGMPFGTMVVLTEKRLAKMANNSSRQKDFGKPGNEGFNASFGSKEKKSPG